MTSLIPQLLISLVLRVHSSSCASIDCPYALIHDKPFDTSDSVSVYTLNVCFHLPLYDLYEYSKFVATYDYDHNTYALIRVACDPATSERIGNELINVADDIIFIDYPLAYNDNSYYYYYEYAGINCDEIDHLLQPYLIKYIPYRTCNTIPVKINDTWQLRYSLWDITSNYMIIAFDYDYTECPSIEKSYTSTNYKINQCYISDNGVWSYKYDYNKYKIREELQQLDLIQTNVGWIIFLAMICVILFCLLILSVITIIFLKKSSLYIGLE